MGTFDEDTLKQLQNSPRDEFGIIHKNILYNKDEDKIFCILDAPDKEAVDKHHNKAGLKCESITEVKSTA
ncbi:MAG: DUF4242 domain-containing protein [Thermoproteota archaeon]|nr:DUF4242 domain-containing protein [Thermoproteota archaeon]